MSLRNSFLGPFQTTLNGKPVHSFESDKARALLAYLVIRSDHPHRRDALAALFWPDQEQEAALKNLRQTLYRLRQALGEGDGKGSDAGVENVPWLLVTSQTAQFNPEAGAWLDVGEFRALIAQCAGHKHRRLASCPSCHKRLLEAAQLYRGDLLSGFSLTESSPFEEWLLLERESLHEQAMLVFAQICAYSEARGDYAQALLFARRQLEHEPWREEAHREAMLMLLRLGQKSAALAQYETCRRALNTEFNIEPGEDTQALYKHIVNSTAAGSLDSLASKGMPPHNLPTELTPFVGRAEELASIAELLESVECRMLTLVGPGGVGKSRLAMKAAEGMRGCFADGIFAVLLQQVDSPDDLATAIANSVGLKLKGDKEPGAQLQAYLAAKEMLILLDNMEHLLPGAALLSSLLANAPHVTFLVTSREALKLRAEIVFDIKGLSYPQENLLMHGGAKLEDIVDYSAVQLFVTRAKRVTREFELTPQTAPGVARISTLLSGLPLGLELAASLTRQFTPAEIAVSVARNADFLRTGFSDMPLQHSSLRAVFDYSWGLLTAQEQNVLAMLSVFRGGSDAAAARVITGASREILDSLSGKSLLTVSDESSDPASESQNARYDMHEMVRQYASAYLQESETDVQTCRTHATYYLRFTEEALPGLSGPNQKEWLDRLELEHDNVRAALAWVRERDRVEDVELGLRASGTLWRFWERRGYFYEGQRWLESLLAAGEGASPLLRAEALRGAATLAIKQGNLERSAELSEKSVSLYREMGDMLGYAGALSSLGNVRREQGEHSAAEALYSRSLEIYRQLEDVRGISVVLNNLASSIQRSNDLPRASALYRESLVLRRQAGDTWGIAYTLGRLAEVVRDMGDLDEAEAMCNQSLAVMKELGDKWCMAMVSTTLGTIEGERNRLEHAKELLQGALAIFKDLGEIWGMATVLHALGSVTVKQGDRRDGERFYRQSLSLFRENGDRHAVKMVLSDLALVERREPRAY